MSKTAFNYDAVSGEIINRVQVSRDSDLVLNQINGLEMLEVASAHTAIGREHEYEIKQGEIKRKAQSVIDKEVSDKQEAINQHRMPEFLKTDEELFDQILIEHINKLNTQAGIESIDIEELKADLESRRELHRNPDKK